MESGNHQESAIDIRELEGEPLDIEERDFEGVETEFKREKITIPEHMGRTFSNAEVVQGFTKGAIKNIISLSETKIRLFEVTTDSINLLSCTEVESKELAELLKKMITMRPRLLKNTKSGSTEAQFLFRTLKDTARLRFDNQTGKLLQAKVSNLESSHPTEGSDFFERSEKKHSKIESYLSAAINRGRFSRDRNEGVFRTIIQIRRLRNNRLTRWLDFEEFCIEKIQKEKARFGEQVKTVAEELRQSLIYAFGAFDEYDLFKDKLRIKAFKYTKNSRRKNLILISARSKANLFIYLIDLERRKVIKHTSVNLLDLIDEAKISEILDLELPNNSNRFIDRPLGAGFRNIENWFRIQLAHQIYLPETQEMIVTIKIKQVQLRVRIGDVFDRKKIEVEKIISDFYLHSSQAIFLRKFGDEGKILTRFTGECKSPQIRPLAWLDPGSLTEQKLNGFEDSDDYFHTNYYDYRHDSSKTAKLSKNRLLLLNDFNAAIYDFGEGRLISTGKTLIDGHEDIQKLDSIQFDDIYIQTKEKSVKIFKAVKSKSGGKESYFVQKTNTVHLNQHFNGLYDDQDFFIELNFMRLKNGNYLYAGSLKFNKDQKGLPISARTELVSLEIDPDSLKVLKLRRKDPNHRFKPGYSGYKLYSVGNYLVFATELKQEIEDHTNIEMFRGLPPPFRPWRYHNRLILTDLDYNILDICHLSQLTTSRPIRLVSNSRIISFGIDEHMHLHQVDQDNQKLVLLKRVKLLSARLSIFYFRAHISSPSFCCSLESTVPAHQHQNVLLKFDLDLELVCSLRLGESTELRGIQALGGSRIAGCKENLQRKMSDLFFIDMESRQVRLVDRSHLSYSKYKVDRESGESFCYFLKGDSILKLFFK